MEGMDGKRSSREERAARSYTMTQPLQPLETTSGSGTFDVCATPCALAFMPYGPI